MMPNTDSDVAHFSYVMSMRAKRSFCDHIYKKDQYECNEKQFNIITLESKILIFFGL